MKRSKDLNFFKLIWNASSPENECADLSQKTFQSKNVSKGVFKDIFQPMNVEGLLAKHSHCADCEWNRSKPVSR